MKLSPLQIARYQYSPKLPGMLRNGISEICVKTADNIVTAASLTTGQDDTDDLLLSNGGVLTLLEGDFVLAVGVGEQSLDLFLIGYALGGAAVLNADLGNTVSEHTGQLGVILVSCQLKRGKLHIEILLTVEFYVHK